MPKGFFFFTTFYYGHMQGFKKKKKYVVQGSRGGFLNYRSFSERQTNFLFYVFDLQGDKLASQHASRKYKLSSVRNLMQSVWRQWPSFTIMRSSYTWRILASHWTINLGIQMAGHNTFGALSHLLPHRCHRKDGNTWMKICNECTT